MEHSHVMRCKKKVLFIVGLLLVCTGLGISLFLFTMFGPPDAWIEGLSGRPLPQEFIEVLDPQTEEYLREFQVQKNQKEEKREISDQLIKGTQLSYHNNMDTEVVQTYSGARWGEGQHLYWKMGNQNWQEIPISGDLTVTTNGFIMIDTESKLLVTDWNAWYPYRFSRLLQSIFRKDLRYEYGLYTADLQTGVFTYLFPGDNATVSPDKTKVAFLRSLGIVSGSTHEIIVWDILKNTQTTVAILTEIDPGSGRSFDYRWSHDSKVLEIAGESYDIGIFQLMYFLDTKRVWHIKNALRQSDTVSEKVVAPVQEQQVSEEQEYTAVDFTASDTDYQFKSLVPPNYKLEYVAQIESISIYDQSAEGDAIRDKSQIFIRKFTANTFLTLKTVDILSREEEKFTGYHTGTDFEIYEEELLPEVPVLAICGGVVKERKRVIGYGGVVIQECMFENQPVRVLYGHVSLDDSSSLRPIGAGVGAYIPPGRIIVKLGADKSEDTDGERKHLHLGIIKGTVADTRGYVPREQELEKWLDFGKLVKVAMY